MFADAQKKTTGISSGRKLPLPAATPSTGLKKQLFSRLVVPASVWKLTIMSARLDSW